MVETVMSAAGPTATSEATTNGDLANFQVISSEPTAVASQSEKGSPSSTTVATGTPSKCSLLRKVRAVSRFQKIYALINLVTAEEAQFVVNFLLEIGIESGWRLSWFRASAACK